jgi:hypothetical protein
MSRAKPAKIAKLKDQIASGWVAGPLRTWHAWRDKVFCFRQLRWRANLREPRKFSSIVVQRAEGRGAIHRALRQKKQKTKISLVAKNAKGANCRGTACRAPGRIALD